MLNFFDGLNLKKVKNQRGMYLPNLGGLNILLKFFSLLKIDIYFIMNFLCCNNSKADRPVI